jgi:hypothetical protein
MSEKSSWPRWRFHKEKSPEGKIVKSEEENSKLGSGWVDSPADFDKSEKKSESKKEDSKQSSESKSESQSDEPKSEKKSESKKK